MSPAATPFQGQVEMTHGDAFCSLVRTYGMLGRVMQPFFMRFGITASQFGVLRTLRCAEEQTSDRQVAGLRQTDLGDRLLVRPPSVTGVIDRLERQGLVAREADTEDHRAKLVCLTFSGRELVEKIKQEHAARVGALMTALSDAEQKELNRMLHVLSSHLEAFCEDEEAAGGTPAAGS